MNELTFGARPHPLLHNLTQFYKYPSIIHLSNYGPMGFIKEIFN